MNQNYVYNNKTVVVIGCGGTGSILTEHIFKHLPEYLTKKKIDNVSLILIDPDVVEEKNTKRQNFYKKDIGKYKVSAIYNRYREHLKNNQNVSVYIYANTLSEFLYGACGTCLSCNPPIFEDSIFFSCIDSVEGRLQNFSHLSSFLMAIWSQSNGCTTCKYDFLCRNYLDDNIYQNKLLKDYPIEKFPRYLIDGGNSIDSGQVKMYPLNMVGYSEYVDDFYPHLNEDKTNGCAELPTQTRLMNAYSAQFLYSYYLDFMESAEEISVSKANELEYGYDKNPPPSNTEEVIFSKYLSIPKLNF